MTKTELNYQENSKLYEIKAKVVDIEVTEKSTIIILDKTIFYPQGGGQPSDTGSIVGNDGTLTVNHVSYNDGFVQHKGKLEGSIQVDEVVTLKIDQALRQINTQKHTAGHIIDQAVKNLLPDTFGIDADHGINGKCFVLLNQGIDLDKAELIKQEIKSIIDKKLPITTRFLTPDETLSETFTQYNLPKNKVIRIVKIGEYNPMPDGGTHLENTEESWAIVLKDFVKTDDNKTKILYEVLQEEIREEKSSSTSKPERDVNLQQYKKMIDELYQSAPKLLSDLPATQDSHLYFFSKSNGKFSKLASELKKVDNESKPEAGKELNKLKSYLNELIEKMSLDKKLEQAWSDPTLPAYDQTIGRRHPVSQAIREISHIFGKLGFTRVRYPEVDWEYYPFEALNMPPNHPARDEWETFFVDTPAHPQLGRMVLTPHTSNGQPREMERLQSQPPIRMINLARTYRRQQDATHLQMFHQFEGLVVDKDITIQDLKGTIEFFAREFYGPGATSRLRPFHFQFTEPSFEVDFSCTICAGTGRVKGEQCKFCKSGWHEVGGAGMVHPNVLRASGIDPAEYTGFAFGWGVERTYALRPGLHLDDIRHLYSGDLRFLQQF